MLDTLAAVRAAGGTCQQIAEQLGISKNAVINRCDRLRLVTGARFRAAVSAARCAAATTARGPDPLPAGHPIAWREISAAPWPGPRYLD